MSPPENCTFKLNIRGKNKAIDEAINEIRNIITNCTVFNCPQMLHGLVDANSDGEYGSSIFRSLLHKESSLEDIFILMSRKCSQLCIYSTSRLIGPMGMGIRELRSASTVRLIFFGDEKALIYELDQKDRQLVALRPRQKMQQLCGEGTSTETKTVPKDIHGLIRGYQAGSW